MEFLIIMFGMGIGIPILLYVLFINKPIKKHDNKTEEDKTVISDVKNEKRKDLKIFGVAITVIFGILFATVFINESSYTSSVDKSLNKVVTNISSEKVYSLEYRITAPGNVDITYIDSNGNTSQSNDTSKKRISVKSKNNDFYYISVQNQEDYGTIKVELYVDGTYYIQNKSDGPYCIAGVKGVLYME